jgi:hypothetical protein
MQRLRYTVSALAYAICNAVAPSLVSINWAFALDCHPGRWDLDLSYFRYVLAATANAFAQPFLSNDDAFDRNHALARHPGRGRCPVLSGAINQYIFEKAETGKMLPWWVRLGLALGM